RAIADRTAWQAVLARVDPLVSSLPTGSLVQTALFRDYRLFDADGNPVVSELTSGSTRASTACQAVRSRSAASIAESPMLSDIDPDRSMMISVTGGWASMSGHSAAAAPHS
ncbi:MAG: hypothetical protein AAFP69_19310, partial [Planctomycetota bacterium]